jgi:EAL domain-containing protein (putative c-di-GMP-specific phosphodiesterase class I)
VYVSHRCDPITVREGRNVRHAGCLLRLVDEKGDTVTKRYFGSIIERNGRYKFLSYTNQF